MWSDSIDFYRAEDHIILWRDIQIDDTEHKGARLRRLRRILEGAGQRVPHAPPVDRELRPLAGRFAFSCAPIRCSCLRSTKTPNAGPRRLQPPIRSPRSADSLALPGADSPTHAAGGADVPADSLGASRSERRPQGGDAADSLGTPVPASDSPADGDADSPHAAPSPLDAPDRPAPPPILWAARRLPIRWPMPRIR